MPSCAVCNATIVFGGHRIGDFKFCSARCLILGRSLYQQDRKGDDETGARSIRELREDLIALAEDLQRQQEMLADTAERLDFLERALIQLREGKTGGAALPGSG